MPRERIRVGVSLASALHGFTPARIQSESVLESSGDPRESDQRSITLDRSPARSIPRNLMRLFEIIFDTISAARPRVNVATERSEFYSTARQVLSSAAAAYYRLVDLKLIHQIAV